MFLKVFLSFLLSLNCVRHLYGQSLWQTYSGVVGAENYTNFHLVSPGAVTIEVISLSGDADVYISDKTRQPNYQEYELKSTTCGLDILEIPKSFIRPVTISIYGHPSYEESSFKLNIYYSIKNHEDDYESYVAQYDPHDEYTTHTQGQGSKGKDATSPIFEDEEESESPWMNLLIGILKIVLDILV